MNESKNRRILIVDDNPAIHDPGRWPELPFSADDWAWHTEPQAACHGRSIFWPRGKVLGGTSTMNGMVYIRGDRLDYDGWRDEGLAGWGWDDVLPWFKRLERHWRGESEYHGGSGPLSVEPQTDGPLQIRGNLEIISGTGRVVSRVQQARLCRCGGSANKPFCDGTHARIGFTSG